MPKCFLVIVSVVCVLLFLLLLCVSVECCRAVFYECSYVCFVVVWYYVYCFVCMCCLLLCLLFVDICVLCAVFVLLCVLLFDV